MKDFPWTLCAATVAVTGAIGTALITRATSERKRVSDEKIANDKLAQDKLIADAREQREAIQYARKELQDQFGDIQTRLGSTEPIIRANAALRLGEFAKTPRPRTHAERTQEPTLSRNPDNHPYFLPVASQLATGLYIEDRPEIRAFLVEAMRNLTDFAMEEDQNLLYALIRRLAEANRTAKTAFIRAMAEYSVQQCSAATEPSDATCTSRVEAILDLNFIASVAPFCENNLYDNTLESTQHCLKSLMHDGDKPEVSNTETARQSEYSIQEAVARAKREIQTADERAKGDTLRLPRLETAAQQLIATRDALAMALNALEPPPGFPTDKLQAIHERIEASQEALATVGSALDRATIMQQRNSDLVILKECLDGCSTPSLSLPACFLAGADLRMAHLENADLRRACLENADLRDAHLENASLSGAHLENANLRRARLENARLKRAHLENARMIGARLENANLSMARLENVDLSIAHLESADLMKVCLKGANLRMAHLENADLSEAHLEYANLSGAHLANTDLCSIHVQEQDFGTLRRTDFSFTNWNEAILTDRYLSPSAEQRKRTEKLFRWLSETFPDKQSKIEPEHTGSREQAEPS